MTKKKQPASTFYDVYELVKIEESDHIRYERSRLVISTNDRGLAKSAVDGSKKPMAFFGKPGEGVYDNIARLNAPLAKVQAPTVRARRKTVRA